MKRQGEKNMTDKNIVEYQVNGETISLTPEIVKQYMVSGDPTKVSNQEVNLFMALCKFQHLNPWLRDAYLIKYSDKSPANLVVSKEAYLKRAQAQVDYKYFEAGLIIVRDGKLAEVIGSFKLPTDQLVGGWAKVYREGLEDPFTAKVSIQEYSTGQSLWKTKPSTMIRKVAIVQAFREAYPTQLGGMYIKEEQESMEEPKYTDPVKVYPDSPNKAISQEIPGMPQEEEIQEPEEEGLAENEDSFIGEDFELVDGVEI